MDMRIFVNNYYTNISVVRANVSVITLSELSTSSQRIVARAVGYS